MSGLGASFYCTPEGGSGYITSAMMPGLPTFEWPQMGPAWTSQTPGWLRNSEPGQWTDYPTFMNGAEVGSIDGMTQPPYGADAPIGPGSYPTPVETSCGMGDLTLLRRDVVAPMPAITAQGRNGCIAVNPCPSAIESWIESNPWIAVGLALAAGYVFFGGKK